jgi:hypothetical protein
MKTIIKTNLFVAVVFLLVTSVSCKKDKSEPDFINDFVPTLTETTGKVYVGTYFPFSAGYNWNWRGIGHIKGNAKFSGGGESNSQPLDETLEASASMQVNNLETVNLTSGTYSLYPTTESGGITRYFLKTDTALLIKAIKNLDAAPVEVKDPVFIRKPLVVGDKWISTPSIDMQEMMSDDQISFTNVTYSSNCIIFVLGKENFEWNSQNRETVKLQERSLVKGSMQMSMDINGLAMSGPVDFEVKIDNKMLLLKDVGIIRQYGTIEMKIWGTLEYMTVPIKMEIQMNVDQDMKLDSYNVVNVASAKVKSFKSYSERDNRKYSSNEGVNKLVNNIINSLSNSK